MGRGSQGHPAAARRWGPLGPGAHAGADLASFQCGRHDRIRLEDSSEKGQGGTGIQASIPLVCKDDGVTGRPPPRDRPGKASSPQPRAPPASHAVWP